MFEHDLDGGVPLVRKPTGEHLVSQRPQDVYIGAAIQVFGALGLLRAHVGRVPMVREPVRVTVASPRRATPKLAK